jgi:hypothetical protein
VNPTVPVRVTAVVNWIVSVLLTLSFIDKFVLVNYVWNSANANKILGLAEKVWEKVWLYNLVIFLRRVIFNVVITLVYPK